MFTPLINGFWDELYHQESKKPYFQELVLFLETESLHHTIYPAVENTFRAFEETPFENVRVVILGQDPYHGEHQANGLAFSVNDSVVIPPSLKNIFQEYSIDLGFKKPVSGDLTKWAEQGVFLLNTTLSVRANQPHSYKAKGWEIFTDSVITSISEKKEHVVFILWGKPAQSKEILIDKSKHLIIKSPHPSPLSAYRGFFGSKPFSKTNDYLKEHAIKEINWKLD